MKWEMTVAYGGDYREQCLEEGWEPFAVVYDTQEGDTRVYFRRPVQTEGEDSAK